jgi:hypothetical protein
VALWGKSQPQIASTQEILKFAEIRDGVVITKTGELRTILMVSSINFALKSEQEQTAIIFAYQNFLNSLDFPIQILMQSKKLDLFNYLQKLKEVVNKQTNEPLRIQTIDYADFIERLINVANIMDKKFYCIISFTPPPKMGGSMSGKPKASSNKPGDEQKILLTYADFQSYKQELAHRTQVVSSGLSSVGLRSAPLKTQQIIELLYSIYNPEEAAKQKLTQFENLTSQVVESVIEKPKTDKPAEGETQ